MSWRPHNFRVQKVQNVQTYSLVGKRAVGLRLKGLLVLYPEDKRIIVVDGEEKDEL